MRTSVRLAAISAVVLTATAAVPVQSPPPAHTAAASATLPTAKELFERYVKAIGGRVAIMAYASRRAAGTAAIPASGTEGTLEIIQAKPNKSLMRITVAGDGTIEEGFDGTYGWSINPVTGPVLLQGTQLEDRREDADFEAGLDLEKNYTAMKTTERVEFDGRQCYKVLATRKSGDEDTIYFDAATGLRAGSTQTRESPVGALTATTMISDYKQFGRILYATRLRVSTRGVEQVITVNTVEHDKVDQSVFTMPVQIKALIK